MLRVFITWSLLILAISPFTAPFSTCDLLALLSRAPHRAQKVEIDDVPVAVDVGDALSVSPLTKKTVVDKPLKPLGPFRPAASFRIAPGSTVAATQSPHDAGRSSQEYFAQPPVLRL